MIKNISYIFKYIKVLFDRINLVINEIDFVKILMKVISICEFLLNLLLILKTIHD